LCERKQNMGDEGDTRGRVRVQAPNKICAGPKSER
jgi:hypothetical protein